MSKGIEIVSHLKDAVVKDIGVAILDLATSAKELEMDQATSEKIARVLVESQAKDWDVPSVQAMLVDLMETEGVVAGNENSEDADVKRFVEFYKGKKGSI